MKVTKHDSQSDRPSARRRILARQLADEVLASVSGGCTTFRKGGDGVWRNDVEI